MSSAQGESQRTKQLEPASDQGEQDGEAARHPQRLLPAFCTVESLQETYERVDLVADRLDVEVPASDLGAQADRALHLAGNCRGVLEARLDRFGASVALAPALPCDCAAKRPRAGGGRRRRDGAPGRITYPEEIVTDRDAPARACSRFRIIRFVRHDSPSSDDSLQANRSV
jgi:hypothetical protein